MVWYRQIIYRRIKNRQPIFRSIQNKSDRISYTNINRYNRNYLYKEEVMEKYKVVIVGAGIAGMSAAINLKRAGINPLIIENNAPGGTLNYIPNIENYPGFESISGPDLAMNIYNQVNNLDIKIKSLNSDISIGLSSIIISLIGAYIFPFQCNSILLFI